MMSKPKKVIRKCGALPFHLRPELSDHMLRAYPQYKHIFAKCPRCGKNSLKPIGLNKINRVTEILDEDKINERRCVCGYTHVKNLVVYNDVTTNEQYGLNIEIIKKGRILEENKEQKDNDSNS